MGYERQDGDGSRSIERDELRNLRVCYACRAVFLPAEDGPFDHPCGIEAGRDD